MQKFPLVWPVIALFAGLLASTGAGAKTPAWDFTAIRERLDGECRDGKFSGVVLIRIRGENAFEHACGSADRLNDVRVTSATRFKIYSTSKFITALTVMRLVESGKMRLDAPIRDYVGDVPDEWAPVTVRQLLNHTSGTADLTGDLVYHFRSDHSAAMRATLAALKPEQQALATPPGAKFAYSNFGYELLADAAARAGAMPFAKLVEAMVFEPAGMTTASLESPKIELGHLVPVSEEGLAQGYNGKPEKIDQAINWAFVQQGAGAVRMAAGDFAALDDALRAGTLVSAATLETMTGGPKAKNGYHLGIVTRTRDGLRMQGHDGGNNGYITNYQRFPDREAMLVSLSNLGFSDTWWLNEAVAKVLNTRP